MQRVTCPMHVMRRMGRSLPLVPCFSYSHAAHPLRVGHPNHPSNTSPLLSRISIPMCLSEQALEGVRMELIDAAYPLLAGGCWWVVGG